MVGIASGAPFASSAGQRKAPANVSPAGLVYIAERVGEFATVTDLQIDVRALEFLFAPSMPRETR
jgi:hypothetical protein